MIKLFVRVLSFFRFLTIVLFYPFWFFGHCTLAIVAGFLPKKLGRKLQDGILIFWSKTSLLWFGIKVEVEGLENIDPNEPVLIVFNHTSLLDIPVIHSFLPYPRFGAKAELFKIPIFGTAMRAAGALPIERNRREKVFQVYREAEKRFAAGESFILAPEGTRQSGEQIGNFKSGPFIFAINSKVRIVPVVLIGVHKVLPKQGLIPNRDQLKQLVKVKVLPPLDARDYRIEERPALQEKTYRAMSAVYHP